MNVLHIVGGDLDEGAAKGAYILHESLLNQGVESSILTNSPNVSNYKEVYSTSNGVLSTLKTSARMKLDNAYKLFYNGENFKFSPGFFGYDITDLELVEKTDIVHLHWICNGFIDVKDLQKIKKPIIWTLRDMWAMTGGCHYSMGCNRFENECGRCPRLNSENEKDISTLLQKRKRNVYPEGIQFVGISKWITNQAKKSSLLKDYDITTISNNIDVDSFFPSEKHEARKNLHLSSDLPIILFGAQYLKSEYKGYDILVEILKRLDFEARVVFFGNHNPAEMNNPNIKSTYLGYLDKHELQKVYSAADLFVSPSKMEAFGKTVAEAMACGTPAVCFDETGSADIVDHKVNGYLAKPFEIDDMIKGIKYLLEYSDDIPFGSHAIEKVSRCFGGDVIAEKYLDLYNEILGERVE